MALTAKKFANTKDADSPLWIEQNHEDYNRRHNGLYIHSADAFGPQSIDDIPAMIETLQAIYDDFEANKPKTFVEQMKAANIGSVVKHSGGGSWMKHDDGMWVSYYGDRHEASSFKSDNFEFVYEA